MGFIYKITNIINNQCYIGQTVQTIEKRFEQHKRNKNYDYFKHLELYEAFNKFGVENFLIEELEETEDLNEAEQKWIKYYDSFNNGYNMTIGGTSRKRLDFNEQEVIEKYLIYKSARKVADFYNVDHNTIDGILNKNKVKRYSLGSQRSKKVIIEKDNIQKSFDCVKDCASWFVEHNICKAKNAETARKGIAHSIKKNTLYYNYKIYYEQ